MCSAVHSSGSRARGQRIASCQHDYNPAVSLQSGTNLGPYEVVAKVGEGGMGTVYRARDSRLDRDVAIKVSTTEFSERFSREARSIAALNHSNVCHLYDVGPNFLVLEYVEGEMLHWPMSFDEALPIIRQLIDGIEAAHENNIIHRDLKTANIKSRVPEKAGREYQGSLHVTVLLNFFDELRRRIP